MERIGVMFVCLGNICRSPLAEAIFNELIVNAGLRDKFHVESSGTAAYHIGEAPDPRTVAVARKNNTPINHRAQQLKAYHFEEFDYIVVMDDSNKHNALSLVSSFNSSLYMMREFDTLNPGSNVIDPWFGNEDGFDVCYETLKRSCTGFLEFLKKEHQLG